MTDPTGITFTERPTLDRPALLVMLAGWIDAAGVAAASAQSLERTTDLRTIATFDGDTFIAHGHLFDPYCTVPDPIHPLISVSGAPRASSDTSRHEASPRIASRPSASVASIR